MLEYINDVIDVNKEIGTLDGYLFHNKTEIDFFEENMENWINQIFQLSKSSLLS